MTIFQSFVFGNLIFNNVISTQRNKKIMVEKAQIYSPERMTGETYVIASNSDGVIQNTVQQENVNTRVRQHLDAVVSTKNTDVLMLVCCVISGLVDSTIYNGGCWPIV